MIDQKSTNVRTQGNKTIVKLYDTDIVSFDDESITLNHGGFKTATTKRRMNQVSETFNLKFNVFQENFKWFVEYCTDDDDEEEYYYAEKKFSKEGMATIPR